MTLYYKELRYNMQTQINALAFSRQEANCIPQGKSFSNLSEIALNTSSSSKLLSKEQICTCLGLTNSYPVRRVVNGRTAQFVCNLSDLQCASKYKHSQCSVDTG